MHAHESCGRDAGPRSQSADRMPDPAAEVRRCARCGEAALVVEQAWQHRFAGVVTGTQTLELACRSCGANVVLHPWTKIRVEQVMAVLFMPAIIPGLFFFFSARKKARAWSENPLVTGAPSFAPRPGPPARRCDCGVAADCVALAREGTWDWVIGRRSDFLCSQCGTRFSVHDVRGVVFMSLAAVALFAAGALVILHPPGSAVGAERSNQGFGVAMLAFGVVAMLVFARRVWLRAMHPHV